MPASVSPCPCPPPGGYACPLPRGAACRASCLLQPGHALAAPGPHPAREAGHASKGQARPAALHRRRHRHAEGGRRGVPAGWVGGWAGGWAGGWVGGRVGGRAGGWAGGWVFLATAVVLAVARLGGRSLNLCSPASCLPNFILSVIRPVGTLLTRLDLWASPPCLQEPAGRLFRSTLMSQTPSKSSTRPPAAPAALQLQAAAVAALGSPANQVRRQQEALGQVWSALQLARHLSC